MHVYNKDFLTPLCAITEIYQEPLILDNELTDLTHFLKYKITVIFYKLNSQ